MTTPQTTTNNNNTNNNTTLNDGEAELHVVGEITGATNFSGHSFLVSYEVITGTQWRHIEGAERGTSHVMENAAFNSLGLLGSSSGGGGGDFAWSLPIDLHYRLSSVQGWPKLSVQVWSVDEYGRKDLAGYGVAFLPMPGQSVSNSACSSRMSSSSSYHGTAGSGRGQAESSGNGGAMGRGGGMHHITIETWKPTSAHGNFGKRVYSQIRQLFMGGNPVLRDDSLVYNNDQRYKLHTMSSGNVTVNVSVMMRNARSVGLSTTVVV